jgi:Ca-activated chloride channel family protein
MQLISNLAFRNRQEAVKSRTIYLFTAILFFAACVFNSTAQEPTRLITGSVYDELATPMPGVSVVVKGTSRGTITDYNGAYSISVGSKDQKLVFSFVGCQTQEVTIGNRSVINVVLKNDAVSMEEVVVTAYGVESKSHLAGAVAGTRIRGLSVHKKEGFPAPAFHQPEFNTEGYSTVHENGFREVMKEPLSTFSVDVDRASYSNVRRFLNSGQLPPVDAVRIEEMINYFSYNYAQPTGKDPFSVDAEMAICPWNKAHYLMKVGLKGKEINKENLPSSNLVFLIDVSGSMNAPNKLPLLKSAFQLLVNELRPSDRVAMVVYAGAAGVVLPSTQGNRKNTIMNALNQLQAGGSTAGGAGLKLAYQIAEENFIKGGNNRIILATDGDFNVGTSSNAEMERLIEKEREKGVFVTVLGFGMGNYKDDKMEIIADKGNGNYAYIDNLQEAEKTLVKEFGGTLFTIAKDVKLQLEFNPAKVAAYRLIGYENRVLNNEDFNNDKKDAGDIGAGHTVTALYEIVPVGAADAERYTATVDPLKYQVSANPVSTSQHNEWLTIKLRYKQPDGLASKLIEKVVKGNVPEFNDASEDLRFASGVAGFGMLLRESEHKNNLSYNDVIQMVTSSRGRDEEGYRSELIRLVKMASGLSSSLASVND